MKDLQLHKVHKNTFDSFYRLINSSSTYRRQKKFHANVDTNSSNVIKMKSFSYYWNNLTKNYDYL